ncbi:MAG: ATP-binding cassette domain-containing protein [Burkholderiales bacterium]|jgi:putative ABC transport system ATP-binding protein|nr:ATP-binding cassette domain-containing protein [Burkholderiales bacterium]MCA3154770.1 ATP-binding cassette domain-containing protein [Burkholderiales bacterium]MCA3156574.1 ATP-binding cassette domain-containing protein [Burkholderiales bacterium]
MLIARHLRHRYDRQSSDALTLGELALEAGRSCVVRGVSGSGKSTLLSILAGLLPPTSGEVLLAGQSLYALSERQRDLWRAQHLGMVPQRHHLLASLSIKQNLQLAQSLAQREDASRLQALMDRLGLTPLARQRPEQLSQGQQQRAALARALVHAPVLVLADEPTSALDDANAHAVIDLMLELTQEARVALLVATHDARLNGLFDQEIRL